MSTKKRQLFSPEELRMLLECLGHRRSYLVNSAIGPLDEEAYVIHALITKLEQCDRLEGVSK